VEVASRAKTMRKRFRDT